MKTVGSYEAKTHLPRLLEEVRRGGSITITRHGVPVARLVPMGGQDAHPVSAVVADIRAGRQGVRLDGEKVDDLKTAGRR